VADKLINTDECYESERVLFLSVSFNSFALIGDCEYAAQFSELKKF